MAQIFQVTVHINSESVRGGAPEASGRRRHLRTAGREAEHRAKGRFHPGASPRGSLTGAHKRPDPKEGP